MAGPQLVALLLLALLSPSAPSLSTTAVKAASGASSTAATPVTLTASPKYTANPFPAACPYGPHDLLGAVNRAVAELLPEGRVEEALACNERALDALSASRDAAAVAALRDLKINSQLLRSALSPWRPGSRRMLHALESGPELPSPDEPLLAPPPVGHDKAIFVADGALGEQQCADLIALFERSKLYEGNVMSAGQIRVDHKHKSRWEFDLSGTAEESDEWAAADRLMVGVLIKHLNLYERQNPILRSMRPGPLGDEGFRMIRYTSERSAMNTSQQHTYHIDGGQEGPGQPARLLAALVYLSEPSLGGETLFLNQGIKVAPTCGRVVIFPSSFQYIHAGRRVRKGRKYAVSLMITL